MGFIRILRAVESAHASQPPDSCEADLRADAPVHGDANIMFSGTGGNDRLVSGANATDYMWGDARVMEPGRATGGHDVFAFGPNNGNDDIFDFVRGQDLIELDGFYKVPLPSNAQAHIPAQAADHLLMGFADLTITTADVVDPFTGSNDGVLDSVIHFDANNSVTVRRHWTDRFRLPVPRLAGAGTPRARGFVAARVSTAEGGQSCRTGGSGSCRFEKSEALEWAERYLTTAEVEACFGCVIEDA